MAFEDSGNDWPGDGPARMRAQLDLPVAGSAALGRSLPGRAVVLGFALAVLAVWGALYAGFHAWRAGYRERAAYGAREVAPAVLPLLEMPPEGVEERAWAGAVGDTSALLLQAVGANVLDRPAMERLGADVRAEVAAATPGTAVGVLVGLWDRLRSGAGPAVRRVPIPPLVEAARLVSPLADVRPAGVEPAAWRLGVAALQTGLAVEASQGRLDPSDPETRAAIGDAVRAALARPDGAPGQMEALRDRFGGGQAALRRTNRQ